MQTVHVGVGLATIKRMIANFNWSTIAETSNLENLFLGIAVVTLDAFTAGATPDPNGDFNQDWYYWTFRSHSREVVTGGRQMQFWDIDLRSMRKLRGGYVLALVVNNGDGNSQASTLSIGMRNLWTQSL